MRKGVKTSVYFLDTLLGLYSETLDSRHESRGIRLALLIDMKMTTHLMILGLLVLSACGKDSTSKSVQNTPKSSIANACSARANGESFPSSDGCNTCSCNNGKMLCTLMACGMTMEASALR